MLSSAVKNIAVEAFLSRVKPDPGVDGAETFFGFLDSSVPPTVKVKLSAGCEVVDEQVKYVKSLLGNKKTDHKLAEKVFRTGYSVWEILTGGAGISQKLDELQEDVQKGFARVESRLDGIADSVNRVEKKIDKATMMLDHVAKQIDTLDKKVSEGFETVMKQVQTFQTAMAGSKVSVFETRVKQAIDELSNDSPDPERVRKSVVDAEAALSESLFLMGLGKLKTLKHRELAILNATAFFIEHISAVARALMIPILARDDEPGVGRELIKASGCKGALMRIKDSVYDAQTLYMEARQMLIEKHRASLQVLSYTEGPTLDNAFGGFIEGKMSAEDLFAMQYDGTIDNLYAEPLDALEDLNLDILA